MEDCRIKTLSIAPHWAWAIIHGPKRIENRTWRTHHRGPLAIHAAGKIRPSDYRIAKELIPYLPKRDQLVCGAIIGVVRLRDCVPLAEVEGETFASGPWCFLLDDPQPLRPRYRPGQLNLFDSILTNLRPKLAQRIQSWR